MCLRKITVEKIGKMEVIILRQTKKKTGDGEREREERDGDRK